MLVKNKRLPVTRLPYAGGVPQPGRNGSLASAGGIAGGAQPAGAGSPESARGYGGGE